MAATAGAVAALATMDAVISVRKMPYIELSVSPEDYNTQIEVKNPSEGENYPRVGLLDSGVEPIPHLEPWLDGPEQNIADLDAADIRHRHGTSVAGIINYGDELQGQPWTGTVPSRITSCVVNTEEDAAHISEDEMIEHVKTAIAANPEVKKVALLYNPSEDASAAPIEQAKQILKAGTDEAGIYYSTYTWIGLMTFVSGLWD